MGAVVPLQQAKALRSLTINGLSDSYSLCYLRLLTQLTALQLAPGDVYNVGLVVGEAPQAPLAVLMQLRALCLSDDGAFHLTMGSSAKEATLPLVLPPHLTRLEVLVPDCRPGRFWRHIAACTGLVSLTVHTESSSGAAADHPSWMLHQLAISLPNLQHFTLDGFGRCAEHTLPQVLGLLAATEAGQQQQQEQGWDWEDLTGLGLGPGTDFKSVMVPPPNMGAFTVLRTLEFPTCYGYSFRCFGPHHWHALAGCKRLQQLRGFEAWGVPPAGVKFLGVTNLEVLVSHPLRDTVAVLGAFPALQQLELKFNAAGTQQVTLE
jgi:hypothetical protein